MWVYKKVRELNFSDLFEMTKQISKNFHFQNNDDSTRNPEIGEFESNCRTNSKLCGIDPMMILPPPLSASSLPSPPC